MSITKSVPLKSYFSMKNKFRKIRIIFEIENWLWKSEFCHFWQLLLNWPQDSKTLLIFGLKEGLVECATVCVKSEVMLIPWSVEICGVVCVKVKFLDHVAFYTLRFMFFVVFLGVYGWPRPLWNISWSIAICGGSAQPRSLWKSNFFAGWESIAPILA